MSLTSNEPSTKFWGPNKRFEPIAGSNTRVLATFFNLQPGEFWNPAWEAELLTPRVLLPDPVNEFFFLATTNFTYALFWNFSFLRLSIRTRVARQQVFIFNIFHGVQQWCIGETPGPTGVFSFRGTATISWFTV